MPQSWHIYVTSVGAMAVLAGLDFAGAIFAKEWTQRHHHALLLAGAVSFLVLFGVYALILQTAELYIVTIGWVVFLQVALLLIDRFRYGVTLSSSKWIAVAVILVLQCYLVLSPERQNTDANGPVVVMSMSPVEES